MCIGRNASPVLSDFKQMKIKLLKILRFILWENTYCILLHMGLYSCRPVRDACPQPKAPTIDTWSSELDQVIKGWPGLINHISSYITQCPGKCGRLTISLTLPSWTPGWAITPSLLTCSDSLNNVLLRVFESFHSCGFQINIHDLVKCGCKPCTFFQAIRIAWWR